MSFYTGSGLERQRFQGSFELPGSTNYPRTIAAAGHRVALRLHCRPLRDRRRAWQLDIDFWLNTVRYGTLLSCAQDHEGDGNEGQTGGVSRWTRLTTMVLNSSHGATQSILIPSSITPA